MARQKSELKSGIGIAARVMLKLTEAVEDLGGSDDDVRRIESDEVLRLDLAKRIVGNTKLSLTHLKLITRNILVGTGAFTKDSFFVNGPKLWFGANFKSRILGAIPENIPAFEGNLSKFELTKPMNDSEILAELGSPQPFTTSEFAAIAKSFIEKQRKGEAGTLLTNGYADIFYVKLPARPASRDEAGGEDGPIVAVHVYWYSHCRGWNLDAYVLGGSGWPGGFCVFSRS